MSTTRRTFVLAFLVTSPLRAQDIYWGDGGRIYRMSESGEALPLPSGCVKAFTADPSTASLYYLSCTGDSLNHLNLRTGQSSVLKNVKGGDDRALMAFDSNRQILYWVHLPPRAIFQMKLSDLEPKIFHTASVRIENLTVNQLDGKVFWIELNWGYGQGERGFATVFSADVTGDEVDILFHDEWNGGFLTLRGPHDLEIDPYERRVFLLSNTTVLNNIPMIVDYLEYFDLDHRVRRLFHTTVAGYRDASLDIFANSLIISASVSNPDNIEAVSLDNCLDRFFCIPRTVIERKAAQVWVDPCQLINHPQIADLPEFVNCVSGPHQTSPRTCYCSDLYLDHAVDLADFAVFQRLVLGEG